MAKKEAKKAATAVKKVKLVEAKKTDIVTTKLKKAKIVEKLAIKKKILKIKVDIKKVNDQVSKNF